jgi:hypothetical protein
MCFFTEAGSTCSKEEKRRKEKDMRIEGFMGDSDRRCGEK